MPDVGLWIKNANIQARCGLNANATAKNTTATDVYVLDVEDYICCEIKFKITAAIYTALDASVRYLLMDVGANICAMYVISQSMGGYASLREAETILDFLEYRISEGMKILKNKDKTDWMGLK